MKYQRLTEREAPLVMTLWEATKVYNRLIELENKIESGELVDRDEYIGRLMAAKDISGMTDKELEFFVKHNAKVRKQAVEEFAASVKSAFYYEFDELIPSIMADKIDALVKEVCGK